MKIAPVFTFLIIKCPFCVFARQQLPMNSNQEFVHASHALQAQHTMQLTIIVRYSQISILCGDGWHQILEKFPDVIEVRLE